MKTVSVRWEQPNLYPKQREFTVSLANARELEIRPERLHGADAFYWGVVRSYGAHRMHEGGFTFAPHGIRQVITALERIDLLAAAVMPAAA